jgi:hypothetical protein
MRTPPLRKSSHSPERAFKAVRYSAPAGSFGPAGVVLVGAMIGASANQTDPIFGQILNPTKQPLRGPLPLHTALACLARTSNFTNQFSSTQAGNYVYLQFAYIDQVN